MSQSLLSVLLKKTFFKLSLTLTLLLGGLLQYSVAAENTAPSFVIADGKVLTDLGSSRDGVRGVFFQPNGGILVAGNASDGTYNEFCFDSLWQ